MLEIYVQYKYYCIFYVYCDIVATLVARASYRVQTEAHSYGLRPIQRFVDMTDTTGRKSRGLQRRCCCCFLLVVFVSLLQGSDGFLVTKRVLKNACVIRLPVVLSKKNDDNDDNKDYNKSYDQKEEESSKKVIQNLTAGRGLGTIVTAAGWAFVLIGFVLNMFGYDYVVRDGRVTIDTVEARQFQMEVNRAMKTAPKSPSSSTSSDVTR